MSREPGWRFSDNADDPCGYCVSWSQGDDPMGEDAEPMMPDGTIAPRVYRFTHADCTAAVIEYTSQDDEPCDHTDAYGSMVIEGGPNSPYPGQFMCIGCDRRAPFLEVVR